MSHFELFIDDDNEIKFDVTIEGTDSGKVSSKLVIETSSGFEVGFDATQMASDQIHFLVPSLKDILKEGTAPARLEVFIDDRRFVPLDLVVDLKKSVKVEAAVRTTRIHRAPSVKAVLSESTPAQKEAPMVKPRTRKETSLDDLITAIERK
jgi:hypothetical protein